MTTPDMKLYIWLRPYEVSYGNSFVLAVAASDDEARRLIRESARWYSSGEYGGEQKPWPDAPVDRSPDRIVDLPCAEFHEWSE